MEVLKQTTIDKVKAACKEKGFKLHKILKSPYLEYICHCGEIRKTHTTNLYRQQACKECYKKAKRAEWHTKAKQLNAKLLDWYVPEGYQGKKFILECTKCNKKYIGPNKIKEHNCSTNTANQEDIQSLLNTPKLNKKSHTCASAVKNIREGLAKSNRTPILAGSVISTEYLKNMER